MNEIQKLNIKWAYEKYYFMEEYDGRMKVTPNLASLATHTMCVLKPYVPMAKEEQ